MYLFVFRSRTKSMQLYDLLRSSGVNCEIINTSRELSASCGLSVRVYDEDAQRAFDVYEYFQPDTLIGVFFYDGKMYRRYK